MSSPPLPRVLLFDLFGTVVHFAPAVPTVEVGGTRWRSSMGWLRDAAEQALPYIRFEDFLATLMAVTGEIVRTRPPEYCEVPSRERFRRALVRLGVAAAEAPDLAERLSVVHMGHLAAQTRLPDDHPTILRTLATRYRLALVSNFDHGPTAHRILAEYDVARFFEPIVISAEFGRRKPHAAIFHAALEVLGAQPAEAWYVGDSLDDDVVGARNAGMPVVWINAAREPLPVDGPLPDHVIERLGDLPALPKC